VLIETNSILETVLHVIMIDVLFLVCVINFFHNYSVFFLQSILFKGYFADKTQPKGTYFLATTSDAPYYTSYQYMTRMHVDKNSLNATGEILFNFDGKTDISLTDG